MAWQQLKRTHTNTNYKTYLAIDKLADVELTNITKNCSWNKIFGGGGGGGVDGDSGDIDGGIGNGASHNY